MGKASIIASISVPPSSDGRELLAIAQTAQWLEIRADLIGDVDPYWIRSFFPGKLLYSLRNSNTGGIFDGDSTERANRLLRASRHYDMVELEAECDLQPDLLAQVPANKRMLSSYGHSKNFSELIARLNSLSATQSNIYKLVVENENGRGALDALCLLKSLGRSDVTAFASGESGFWSRLVAPRFGAPIIFASASQSWSPDGTPPVLQLIKDYNLPSLAPINEIYGIIGNPIIHSLSPRMHNAAYRVLQYPALFVPFQVNSFNDFWCEVVTSGRLEPLGLSINGLTIASPYKETVLQKAETSSSMSQRIGAANLFVRDSGIWKADTTDPAGVMLAIKSLGSSVKGKKAAVVGCGGAGRAIAASLNEFGSEVTLVNRGLDRGRLASRLLGLPFVPLSSFDTEDFSILVNATPVGREDNKMLFDLTGLSRDALIIDLVYGSRTTPLIANALASGLRTIEGREVLMIQVIHQFRKMTGLDMPTDIAKRILGPKEKASIASLAVQSNDA